MVSPLASLVSGLGRQINPLENIGQDITNIQLGQGQRQLQQQQLQQGQFGLQQQQKQATQKESLQKAQFLNRLGKRLLQTDESQWGQVLGPNVQVLQQLGFSTEQLSGLTREQIEGVVAQTDAVLGPQDLQGRSLDIRERELEQRRDLALRAPELAGLREAEKLEAQLGRKAGVAREVRQATRQAEISSDIVEKSFEQMGAARKNISNIDRAISAIDKGAKTGAIERFLPSIRTASRELDQIRGELGLDVVGAVTFGALSKGELDLAMDTALPTGLDEPQLKLWLERKREAQTKVIRNLREAALFLSEPGNTVADFIRSKDQEQGPDKNQILRFDAQGNLIQ
jgi:hypothetical protein